MCLFHAVRDTRSYEAGLDAGLLLPRVAEQHHAHITYAFTARPEARQ